MPYRTVLPILALFVLGCSNDREDAVKQTLAFAQEAPYMIGSPAERSSGVLLAVKDSALTSYNRIFKYFEPKDSSRATVYGTTPQHFLFFLPITHLDKLWSRKLPADTLQVVAVFSRPERTVFEKTLFEVFPSRDSVSATSNQQIEFQRFITRSRQGLQDTDTALFWVVDGPRIVRFVTAHQIRDSVAMKGLSDAQLKEFTRFINVASFSKLGVTRYPVASSYNLEGGGSITGMLDPGSAGWPKPAVAGDMHVTCEARNGEEAVREVSYVILRRLSPHEKDKVLCLWASEEGQKWNDLKPNTFRLRLVGVVGRDSVTGNWVEVPAR
jgi:hypothetical protein